MGQRVTRWAALGAVAAMVVATLLVLQGPAEGAGVSHHSSVGTQVTNNFWLATATGHVYSFGVINYGSPGSAPLNQPIVTMVPSQDRHGYWLVASDGGVFSSGGSPFYGSRPRPAGTT